MTTYEIADEVGCSQPTAWRVLDDAGYNAGLSSLHINENGKPVFFDRTKRHPCGIYKSEWRTCYGHGCHHARK
ncbi:MAG: hypothetical protein GWN59_06015, partial [Calditrichae bacterium]|nr:hypothetical protein [Calditrichia bacterium]